MNSHCARPCARAGASARGGTNNRCRLLPHRKLHAGAQRAVVGRRVQRRELHHARHCGKRLGSNTIVVRKCRTCTGFNGRAASSEPLQARSHAARAWPQLHAWAGGRAAARVGAMNVVTGAFSDFGRWARQGACARTAARCACDAPGRKPRSCTRRRAACAPRPRLRRSRGVPARAHCAPVCCCATMLCFAGPVMIVMGVVAFVLAAQDARAHNLAKYNTAVTNWQVVDGGGGTQMNNAFPSLGTYALNVSFGPNVRLAARLAAIRAVGVAPNAHAMGALGRGVTALRAPSGAVVHAVPAGRHRRGRQEARAPARPPCCARALRCNRSPRLTPACVSVSSCVLACCARGRCLSCAGVT